ncbi:hypothetical protein COOONC_14767 [Cooperia oncophora]
MKRKYSGSLVMFPFDAINQRKVLYTPRRAEIDKVTVHPLDQTVQFVTEVGEELQRAAALFRENAEFLLNPYQELKHYNLSSASVRLRYQGKGRSHPASVPQSPHLRLRSEVLRMFRPQIATTPTLDCSLSILRNLSSLFMVVQMTEILMDYRLRMYF